MATKNQAYDHPAYLAGLTVPTGQVNGASGVSTKFTAFTSLTVKSVTLYPTTAGTSSDNMMIMKLSGTTTTTTTYGTFGSGGAVFQNLTPAVATNQVSAIQGDVLWLQKGADATGTYVGALELVVAPLANITV